MNIACCKGPLLFLVAGLTLLGHGAMPPVLSAPAGRPSLPLSGLLGKGLPDYETVLGKPVYTKSKGKTADEMSEVTVRGYQRPGFTRVVITHSPETQNVDGQRSPLGPAIQRIELKFSKGQSGSWQAALGSAGISTKGLKTKPLKKKGSLLVEAFKDGGAYANYCETSAWCAAWHPATGAARYSSLVVQWLPNLKTGELSNRDDIDAWMQSS